MKKYHNKTNTTIKGSQINKWCLSTNTEGVLEWVRGAIGLKKLENQTQKNVSLHFMAIYP